LQEREVQRVGGDRTIKVDVRVIAATNADLMERIKTGEFRSDLFYRLNVVSLRIPPLRERVDDILPLAHHFLRQHDSSGRIKGFDPLTAQILRRHPWPGNVRELQNVIERACLLSRGDEITAADLPPEFHGNGDASRVTPPPLGDDFTTVPVQIYNWTIRPQEAFRENAAAAIIVLMVAILSLNLVAAVIRERFRRHD